MKPHQTLQLGLAGLGFVLALPAQAALPPSTESSVEIFANGLVLAQRDDADNKYESRRDNQGEQRTNVKGGKNHPLRESERPSAPQDYGYGYERRQRPSLPQEDSSRGRH